MRTAHDIHELIARALHEKELQRQREARLLAEEVEARRVFLQAARAVFTHVIMPEMERFGGILHQARMRPTVSDTGAFYLPGSSDASLVAKFALPLLRDTVSLPLSVSFEAVFPVGMAIYYGDAEAAHAGDKAAIEEVPLEDVTRDLVEDHLVRVLENHLHEL
ncbi:hypothetical protein FHP25_26665 [Vineibacter terrae]|uniref:Uncharacterized protein n=1 Tax=Vineibacter terrae TaxID=2586908 RepID=A0A5C8PFY7_9HYPH|nr:hypothetical protein [Vineibacter terrae]TXL72214.1 hypothetical protein FHP25_26665 [Vineibacter terrae]